MSLDPVRVHVFHADSLFSSASFPEGYMRVATVDVRSAAQVMDVYDVLDRAFERTNHINHPWWENEGVVREGTRQYRSSSVGDVFVFDTAQDDPWLCVIVGWKRLSDRSQA